MEFKKLNKLKRGDSVAILSPSFAAPGKWPHVHELGLKRLTEAFGLIPVEFPTTRKLGATKEERAADLMAAFEDKRIKAIITTLGGNDQITYVKNLKPEIFKQNPKPFFGYSDNTHFMNFLWLNGIPSYYGGALFTQFAVGDKIHEFTSKYLNKALFEKGIMEISASQTYNDISLGHSWDDPQSLGKARTYEANEGWVWEGNSNTKGVTWGGCLESIDEILRHGIEIPSLKEFENIILIFETSEEIPSADYVFRVLRALGERGILEKVKGVLAGRPKAWEFNKQLTTLEKAEYKAKQRETVVKTIRKYNQSIPIVQNLDFGHTDPQIPFPYGKMIEIDSEKRKIRVEF